MEFQENHCVLKLLNGETSNDFLLSIILIFNLFEYFLILMLPFNDTYPDSGVGFGNDFF